MSGRAEREEGQANLGTPLQLPELDTPVSTSSLTFTPSDITPPVAALEGISLSSPNEDDLTSGTATMDAVNDYNASSSSATPSPAPDLHRVKHQNGPPGFSRTEGIMNFGRAFNASKKLQQIMGLQHPDPFVMPPEIPKGFVLAFVAGLRVYGLNHKGRKIHVDGAPEIVSQAMYPQAKSKIGAPKSELPGIKEERNPKSPIESTHTESPAGFHESNRVANLAGMTINPSVLDTNANTDFNSSQKHFSRPGSSPIGLPSYPVPMYDLGSNTVETEHASEHESGYGYTSVHDYDTGSAYTSQAPHGYGSYDASSEPRPSSSLRKVLFPSPRVEQPEDFAEADNGTASSCFVPGGHAVGMPSGTQALFLSGLFDQQQTPSGPQITVQAPSPRKDSKAKSNAKKRSLSVTTHRPLTRPRGHEDSGLPILDADSEALWKLRFPGNTHGLMTILLSWSHTMQSMYNLYPNPKGFSYNTAFPWPVKPPVYQRLVSVSFYDTNFHPHKEVRFLGPGDAAEIIYGEVDTFRSQAISQELQEHNQKIDAVKKALRIGSVGEQKGSAHMPSHHLAVTGEGRWAYVLVKGHQLPEGGTAPQLMIAFHISAVVDSSTCLHTIFPDGYGPSASAMGPPNPVLQRLGSLQNLAAAPLDPYRLHEPLRSASTSVLPQVKVDDIAPQGGALTMHRTVLGMRKAGDIPLIEGHMVDVGKFRGWLDAVSRGSGKVVMWSSKE